MKSKSQNNKSVFTLGHLVSAIYDTTELRGKAAQLAALLINSGRVKLTNFARSRVI